MQSNAVLEHSRKNFIAGVEQGDGPVVCRVSIRTLAFEDGNPNSALSAAQVASLESIMDNLQPFEMIVTGDFTQGIDSNFKVNIAWDITASVSQTTTGGG